MTFFQRGCCSVFSRGSGGVIPPLVGLYSGSFARVIIR